MIACMRYAAGDPSFIHLYAYMVCHVTLSQVHNSDMMQQGSMYTGGRATQKSPIYTQMSEDSCGTVHMCW